MTKAEINETIARACGYDILHVCKDDGNVIVASFPAVDAILDYTTDANACFDACEKLGYAPCIVPNIDEHGKIIYGVAVLQVIDEGLFGTSEDELVGYEITPLLARAIAEAVRKGGE